MDMKQKPLAFIFDSCYGNTPARGDVFPGRFIDPPGQDLGFQGNTFIANGHYPFLVKTRGRGNIQGQPSQMRTANHPALDHTVP